MLYFILIFSLILRLINLNQSLWLDEAIQTWAVSNFNLNKLLAQFMPTDVHPPLSYLVSFFTGKLIGYSEMALRLPSVIFGVLSIYIVYKLAKLIKLTRPIIPALLLAASGLHIYYSQEARMYSLATLLVSLSIYFLIKSFKDNQAFFYYTLFSFLAVITHYYTWFMLPVHLLITKIIKPKKLKKLFLSQLLIIIGFLPILPTLIHQLKGGLMASLSNPQWGSTVGGLNIKSLALIPVKFLIGRITFDNKMIYALVAIVPILISTYLFYLLLKNLNKLKTSTTIIVSWLFIPLILAALISTKIPVLSFHRFLFILPAFYLSISLGIEKLRQPIQNLVFIFFIVFNLGTAGIYLFNPTHHREDWKTLTSELSLRNQTQAPVAILASVKTPLIYYYAGEIINYSDITSDFKNKELWLVPYAEPIFDPGQVTRVALERLGFKSSFKKHFRGDLTLIQYTNENRD